MDEQSVKQKIIVFATSENVQGAVELMKKCRTQLTTVIAKDEFNTLVNALTLEIEANMIQRLVVTVERIRTEGQQILDE